MTNAKRTINAQIAAPAAQPDLPGMPPQGWGVGNTPPSLSPAGGGYLSICMPFEFSVPDDKKIFDDPRIGQLKAMGLRGPMIKVAQAIGFEAFMAMWQIFDAEPVYSDHGPSALRITMPPYRSWKRYQRNRYMEHLLLAGFSNDEVQDRLEKQLHIDLEGTSVRRLRRKIEGSARGRNKSPKNHVAQHGKKG